MIEMQCKTKVSLNIDSQNSFITVSWVSAGLVTRVSADSWNPSFQRIHETIAQSLPAIFSNYNRRRNKYYNNIITRLNTSKLRNQSIQNNHLLFCACVFLDAAWNNCARRILEKLCAENKGDYYNYYCHYYYYDYYYYTYNYY
jgi:hypothetical protein